MTKQFKDMQMAFFGNVIHYKIKNTQKKQLIKQPIKLNYFKL